jgi:hypothetical protein
MHYKNFILKNLLPIVFFASYFTYAYSAIYSPYKTIEINFLEAKSALEIYFQNSGHYPTLSGIQPYSSREDLFANASPFEHVRVQALKNSDAAVGSHLKYVSNGVGYALLQEVDQRSLHIAKAINREIVLHADASLLGIRTRRGPTECLPPLTKRFTDLKLLDEALRSYKDKYGNYPVSIGFSGCSSRYGASGQDYIPGLAPEFIPYLPCAFKTVFDGLDFGYLYRSDGLDFALIVFDRDFCNSVKYSEAGIPCDHSEECNYAGFTTAGAAQWTPRMIDRRIYDLQKIKIALEKYKLKNSEYPKSTGFDGYYSYFGYSGPDWIKGLSPDYIDTLPRDPRYNDDPSNQYLYASDGQNYKLIAHHPDDCEALRRVHPQMVDPVRQCGAYGYWTQAASNW